MSWQDFGSWSPSIRDGVPPGGDVSDLPAAPGWYPQGELIRSLVTPRNPLMAPRSPPL